ncbi:hypothetical protein [Arthrobacter sp. B1805]|uniref:hypothetical protein n=1 Tax=Arthrobacter sp. B1805 TaxID=2058892 RepID=UPI0015E2F13C|nr:hypothetical protein [Arthrobacter sp. B1805]
MYGRSDEAWDQLVQAGHVFLLERAKLNRPTTYTELNAVLHRRTELREFDFNQADERAAMGHLLGRIVALDREQFPKQMISALVIYLNENDAGSGFYQLAQSLDLLEHRPSAKRKESFWLEQLELLKNR